MPVTFRSGSRKSRLKDLLRRGDAANRRGFWREREAEYCAALALDPSLKHIWVQYGHALKEQGHLDAAEQAYRRSLALDATLADTSLQLGQVLKLQGRTADAADAYLTAHRLDPDLPEPNIELQALGLAMPPIPPGNSEFSADPEFIEAVYGTAATLAAVGLPNRDTARSGTSAEARYVSREHVLRAHGLAARILDIFDFRYYYYANPSVQSAVGKLSRQRCLLHFCTHGISDVLQCNADLLFDTEFYCFAYLPWRLSASNAYWHWLNVGVDKGSHPSRFNWFRDILGSDAAARTSFDFAPCRTFFYPNEVDARWTVLFDRFLDAEVLCNGPHLPVTPETADFFAAIAGRFVFRGNDDAAARVCERVLQSLPHHKTTQLTYADCLQRKRLFAEAAAIYADIIESNEASVWCFLHQATCYAELGDLNQALISLHSGINRFPGEFRLRERFETVADRIFARELQLARAIGKLGRYREAQSRMQEACEFISSKMAVTERLRHKPIRSVAIVGNLDIPQCYFYRIEQKVEHLAAAGYNVLVYNFRDQLNHFVTENYKYEAVIFYRVPASVPILAAIAKAKEMGLVTFYDIDDLMFVEDDYPGTFESYLSQITLDQYVELMLDVPRYRHVISLCDYAIAPTSALASEMGKLAASGQAFVHRNAFGRRHEQFAMKRPAPRASDPIIIFYGSGTKRHKEDFHDLVEPALVEIVERYGKRIHIVLAGYPLMSEPPESIRQNVTLIDPIWNIDVYWSILQCFDINLAVLKKNLVTDCKSELKWMEAAMFGIPSVVSATDTHMEVIEPCVTGLICNTTEEWVAALDLLVRDEALRRRIGLAARQRVLDAYNIRHMSENLVSIFAQTAPPVKSPPKPTIVIVNDFYPPQVVGEATRIVCDNVRYLAEAYHDDFQIEVFTSGWGIEHEHEPSCYVRHGVRVTAVYQPVSPEIEQADWDRRMEERFGEYLDRVDPALVHFHCIQRLTGSVVSAALARGIPYLITAHDCWWISGEQFIVNEAGEPYLYDYLDPLATALKGRGRAYRRSMLFKEPLFGARQILADSEKSADLHRRCGVPNVVTIANGITQIDACARTASPDGRVRLALIGGTAPATGYVLVKHALLSRTFEHLRLTVIDAGLEPGSSRQEVWNTTPVEFVAEFAGDQVPEFLAGIDVLLAPSVGVASSGLHALEAVHCGCWVVASDRGSIGDCITHGENGYVIDVSEATELISVLTLIDGAPQRYLQAPSARPVLRRSSEQGDELAEIYKSIVLS
jgi:glycosyltransferase involved in cell wall biosynthesis